MHNDELLVLVIFWGVGDVVSALYKRLLAPPFMLLEIRDILKTFAAFLALLIAIEIYQKRVSLITGNAHNGLLPMYVFATAAVTLALKATYYLLDKENRLDETA